MTDWIKPALTSTYTNFITELKYRDEVVGSLFSTDLNPTPSNLPANNSSDWGKRTIRWNNTLKAFQRRNSVNNAWERLEGNNGTHSFVNLSSTNITASANIQGVDITATDELTAARFNVTGNTAPANGFYLPAANEVRFTTNSQDVLTIESTGEVGIGTVDPEYTLDINGTFRIQNGSNDSSLEVGKGGSGNRQAYIDLVGDGTYTDYGFRIIRGNQGTNAFTSLIHRGTGSFTIECNEAADMKFVTSNDVRFTIHDDGDISVGTYFTPSDRLHIKQATDSGVFYKS